MTIVIPDEMRRYVASALLDYASVLAVLPSPSAGHSAEMRRVMAWMHEIAALIEEETWPPPPS